MAKSALDVARGAAEAGLLLLLDKRLLLMLGEGLLLLLVGNAVVV